MSKVGLWSTTAANNNSTPPDGWPEGQAPSTINDCAREMMAAIRTYLNDAQFFDMGNTPSYLSATTFSLATADVANFHVGRRLKLNDATTLYGVIDSVSSTFVSVRLDAGALTQSLSSVALSILTNTQDAIPASVRADVNYIMNGALSVWQVGTATAVEAAAGSVNLCADRFWLKVSSSAKLTITRSEYSATATNVPTITQAGIQLGSSICISVSAADAAVGAGEFVYLETALEGYDFANVAQRQCMLSFWALSNKTGQYSVSLRNGSGTASVSFVQAFTLSAASTWTKFMITVDATPTTATWNYTDGLGLRIGWTLVSGSTYQGGAGNWTATNLLAHASQVNFASSAGNVFKIAGLKLQPGTVATPITVANYADELRRCQRYYWRGMRARKLSGNAYTANAVISWPISFPTTMRVIPTMAQNIDNFTGLQPAVDSQTVDGFRVYATVNAASTNTFTQYHSLDYVEAYADFG